MKITFIALALEGIKLSKLHRSGRIISRINNCLNDEELHINDNMTGNQLFEWYNKLDEENQVIIDGLSLFLPEEEQYVIKDIYNVRIQHELGYESERKRYKLVVAFLATGMVIVTVLTNGLYHILAKQEKLVAHSNIAEAFFNIYSEVSEYVTENDTASKSETLTDVGSTTGEIPEVTEVLPTE